MSWSRGCWLGCGASLVIDPKRYLGEATCDPLQHVLNFEETTGRGPTVACWMRSGRRVYSNVSLGSWSRSCTISHGR